MNKENEMHQADRPTSRVITAKTVVQEGNKTIETITRVRLFPEELILAGQGIGTTVKRKAG